MHEETYFAEDEQPEELEERVSAAWFQSEAGQ